MPLHIRFSETESVCNNQIIVLSSESPTEYLGLGAEELIYIKQQREKQKKDWIAINRYNGWLILVFVKTADDASKRMESCRRIAFQVLGHLNGNGEQSVCLQGFDVAESDILSFAEGMALGNYQFIKYRKDAGEKKNSLEELLLKPNVVSASKLEHLKVSVEATLWARDLVNEPLNQLNATDLANAISEKLRGVGAKAEVFNKKKIESLKMGGLLSVNLGSIDPPTFTIMEWKPEDALNKQPIVMVGKGVVYDTGGMSLKPSNSMDTMKCDMSGSATVSAVLFALAKLRMPLHVIALVPATDNRVNGNAFVPGDIITMFDGTTVEVLNTDAEGRLILADALSYAKKFNPMMVVNFATLTGAASRAIGSQGIVAMQVKAETYYSHLNEAGKLVYERLAEFPMWEEYKDQLKSEIADLKNIGGAEAGMITAGKFLEYFTDYPFIHLDIAGPAFLDKRDNYRSQGGTGVGVRLMLSFFAALAENERTDQKR